MFPEATTHKIFEINSSFHVNGKSLVSVIQEFSASINKTSIYQEECAPGYHSMKLRYFPDISKFPKILVLCRSETCEATCIYHAYK